MDSRTQAAELISSGAVLVGGSPADKPARLVGPDEPVLIREGERRFVGRGAHKLNAALEAFSIDPVGLQVVDVGSSTGGFTDCLLQAHAATVVAVDVGRGQLHEKLRADPRVISRERTDVRSVSAPDLGGPFDLVVADLSFISVRSVATHLVALARPGSDLVVLVKPQFEVGRKEASRHKGVIRDPQLWREALHGALASLEAAGAVIIGLMVSPLRGADGNVEFLAHARRPNGTGSAVSAGLEPTWGNLVESVLTDAPAGVPASGLEV